MLIYLTWKPKQENSAIKIYLFRKEVYLSGIETEIMSIGFEILGILFFISSENQTAMDAFLFG